MKEQKVVLMNEMNDLLPGFILNNAQYNIPVITKGSHKGQTVVICGAGPSLRAAASTIRQMKGEVWGCNAALPWLVSKKLPVTHGVCIDQRERLATEVWRDLPAISYYLASSVHPRLIEHVQKHDRPLMLFHNFVGFNGEFILYQNLYANTVIAAFGLNVVNRMMCVAEYMGFGRIVVAGADCAFGKGDEFHAQGDKVPHYKNILEGVIDGRTWRTTPDMLYSAVDMVKQTHRLDEESKGRVKLIGDTLPKALLKKSDDFLDRCARWAKREELAA